MPLNLISSASVKMLPQEALSLETIRLQDNLQTALQTTVI